MCEKKGLNHGFPVPIVGGTEGECKLMCIMRLFFGSGEAGKKSHWIRSKRERRSAVARVAKDRRRR